jgi:hypothetical protein
MVARNRCLVGGLIIFALMSVLISPDALAANFTASISPGSVNGSMSGRLFNVTINNTDGAHNITRLNITLPAGFTFVTGSNWTDASDAVFSNTSAILTWENATAAGFIDMNWTVGNFSFNSSTPGSSGNYTITVYVFDTNMTSNSTNLTVTVDADAPGISLGYPGNNTNLTSSGVTFNFTATDSIDGNLTCNLTVNGSVVQSGFGAESGNVTSRAVSGLTVGQNSWSVICWDDFNHVTTSNTSFFGIYTDLNVSNVQWTSTGNNHPFTGSNVTINATILNAGSFNFTGNITVYLYWEGSKIANQTVANTSLTSGSSYNVVFGKVTSDSLVTNGLHTITVEADALDAVTEYNESNNNRTIQLFVGYNVTIVSLKYNGTVYDPPYMKANKSYIINVSVRYGNGDPVTGLVKSNFTYIYDKYGGSTVRTWGSGGSNGQYTSLQNFTSTMNSSGVYWFTVFSYYDPTSPRPGVHNLTVVASNGSYTGSSQGLDYYYLLAPQFTVSFSSLLTSITEGSSDGFNVLVTNTGKDSLYSAVASIIDEHDYLTFSTCSGSANVTNDSNSHLLCSSTMTALSVSSDQDGSFRVNVSGRSNGLMFYTISSIAYVSVDNSGTTTTGGTTTTTTQCSSDSDCSTGYRCSGGTCVKKTYSISITSYTSSLEVDWGSYVTTKVTVKNEGSYSFTAKMSVTLDGLDASILPTSMTLDPGNAIMFTINLSTSGATTVGTKTGTLKAYVNEDTGVYQTKSFTVNVIPTEEKKKDIGDRYYNYSTLMNKLKERFDRLKTIGFVNESNITEIEGLINITYLNLNQVKSAIDREDYATADSILATLNASINSIDSKIDAIEAGQRETMGGEWSGVWFWVVVGVVIVIVAVFMVYLLMPSMKGYHPSRGYKPVIRESVFDRIKKVFRRRKPGLGPIRTEEIAPPAYEEGYRKIRSKYRYGGEGKIKGSISSIKSKLKRKKPQKEVSDYFS